MRGVSSDKVRHSDEFNKWEFALFHVAEPLSVISFATVDL